MTTTFTFPAIYWLPKDSRSLTPCATTRHVLPDETTEKLLGMSGGESGRNLYGAFTTLKIHGRSSRTMLE
jgi:hypothetical protein